MPKSKCDKEYVIIKNGCSLLNRKVQSDEKGNYITLNSTKTYLNDKALRGKFRYSSTKVCNTKK